MDLLAHAITERAIDQLVALHRALALEQAGNDEGVEVAAIALDLEEFARQAFGDESANILGSNHRCSGSCVSGRTVGGTDQ